MAGEWEAISAIEQAVTTRLGKPPAGELWLGDDAAVLRAPEGPLLLCADALVDKVHVDLSWPGIGAEVLGWRALATNVSDIAAMGGRPLHAVVTVAAPAGFDLCGLYEGLLAVAGEWHCPVVGGDLTSSAVASVSVAVTGTVDDGGPPPVRRDGARPGDTVFVTRALGGGAAGLREVQAGGGVRRSAPNTCGGDSRGDNSVVAGAADWLVDAFCWPCPEVAAGTAARWAGATAMIDVSDGLTADLGHILERSGVGADLEEVPLMAGAMEEDALFGGEDYALVFCAPSAHSVVNRFAVNGLPAPHIIGRVTGEERLLRVRGRVVHLGGWTHSI